MTQSRNSIRLCRLVFQRNGDDWDVYWFGPVHTYMLHPFFVKWERGN